MPTLPANLGTLKSAVDLATRTLPAIATIDSVDLILREFHILILAERIESYRTFKGFGGSDFLEKTTPT